MHARGVSSGHYFILSWLLIFAFNISRVFLTLPRISSLYNILRERRLSSAYITYHCQRHSVMHIHTAIDLRCKHTTGNIRVTLLRAEDACDTSGRRTRRRSRFVRVEAHRGRNKTLVTSGRRGANDVNFSIVHRLQTWWCSSFSSYLSLLFYFYFILNPIPYLYLWISVKRCIRSIRTATSRHFFVERRFHLNFSLFLSFFLFSLRVLATSVFSSTHQWW